MGCRYACVYEHLLSVTDGGITMMVARRDSELHSLLDKYALTLWACFDDARLAELQKYSPSCHSTTGALACAMYSNPSAMARLATARPSEFAKAGVPCHAGEGGREGVQ